jgi:hypothetical protein
MENELTTKHEWQRNHEQLIRSGSSVHQLVLASIAPIYGLCCGHGTADPMSTSCPTPLYQHKGFRIRSQEYFNRFPVGLSNRKQSCTGYRRFAAVHGSSMIQQRAIRVQWFSLSYRMPLTFRMDRSRAINETSDASP